MTDEDKDRAMVEAIRARHVLGFSTASESPWELHKDRHDLLRVVKDLQKQSQDYAQLKLEYVREAARLDEAQKVIDRQAEETRLLREVVRADGLHVAAVICGTPEAVRIFTDKRNMAHEILDAFDKFKPPP